MEIKGQSLTFSSEIFLCGANGLNAMFCEVFNYFSFNKRFYAKAKVVDISPLFMWRYAAALSQWAIYGDEINHRGTSSQMRQSKVIAALDDRTTQNVAIKGN
jgi:hypothetical protein